MKSLRRFFWIQTSLGPALLDGLLRGVVRLMIAERWLSELVAPSEHRQRLRAERERLQEQLRDGDAMLRAEDSERLDALERFVEHYGDEGSRQRGRVAVARMRAMQAESDCLQAIRKETADDLEAAVAAYREYVREQPDSHLGYGYLARGLRKAGDLPGAALALEEALRAEGQAGISLASSRLELAEVYAELGDSDRALAELDAAMAAAKRDPLGTVASRAQLLRGDLVAARGDRAGAREAWKQAARLDGWGEVRKQAKERLSRRGG